MAKKKESRKVAIEAVRTSRKRLLTNESPFAIKEAYVKLRTSLMFCMTADKERPCTSFAVTSAKPSEGKSLTAANIAISYAMLGKKVLLIDADIVRLLRTFREQPQTLLLPEIPDGSFAKKLYSTYLSYLPPEKIAFPLKMNVDERGSFTELLKTASCGQVSVNIIRPGVTKGQHWHNSKWEFFIVVAGHGLIQERQIGSDEKIEFEVSGDRIQAVHMLPGYTHNIINLSETENLVTVMWANEQFDPSHPDTYFEEV